MRAYLDTAIQFGIPAETMLPYFRAMRDDLVVNRFPTFDDLLYYMGGSAIPVGRAMTYILGVRPPYSVTQALPGADSLSISMQLSNFWRDIGHDLGIGRVYLPQEDLARFNLSEAELYQRRVTRGLVDLLEFEFDRTE
jgi:phytoene synthase